MRIPLPPVPLSPSAVEMDREISSGTRAPAEPRDAATVLLLRDAATGPEVYLLRRQLSMDFAGGMHVFPGGGVDPRDFDAQIAWVGPAPEQWAGRLGTDTETARALVCAAVRETFEESGVLLAGPVAAPDEVVADTTGADWEADRVALEGRELSLTDFLQRRGLALRADLLQPFAAWLTPAFEPKRYRTWFFVTRLPAGQRTRDVSRESSRVAWLGAETAAAGAEAGEVQMLPPTWLGCLEVAGFADVDGVLGACAERSVQMFMPEVTPLGEGHTLTVPAHLEQMVRTRRGLA